MRNVCHVDVLVGPRDKLIPPAEVARRLFGDLKGCRVLTAVLIGPQLTATLLLPEMRGGYSDTRGLKDFIELGLNGKSVVLASVHGIREATATEVLERVLNGRR